MQGYSKIKINGHFWLALTGSIAGCYFLNYLTDGLFFLGLEVNLMKNPNTMTKLGVSIGTLQNDFNMKTNP